MGVTKLELIGIRIRQGIQREKRIGRFWLSLGREREPVDRPFQIAPRIYCTTCEEDCQGGKYKGWLLAYKGDQRPVRVTRTLSTWT